MFARKNILREKFEGVIFLCIKIRLVGHRSVYVPLGRVYRMRGIGSAASASKSQGLDGLREAWNIWRQNRRMGRYRNCLRKCRNIGIRVAGDCVDWLTCRQPKAIKEVLHQSHSCFNGDFYERDWNPPHKWGRGQIKYIRNSTIANVTGASHPIRKDPLAAKPPRVESVPCAATFFRRIDHRIKSQPILIVITTVGTGERPILFSEQYLFTLFTSLHISTSDSAMVIAPAEMHRDIRSSIKRATGDPFRVLFIHKAKIRPMQYIVLLLGKINNI
jgi:hypothetical protein